MKNAGTLLLFVSASALLLAACASQSPVKQTAPATAARAPSATPTSTSAAPRPADTAPGVTVVGTRYSGTRRVEKDGVVYFCERPTKDNSHFIAKREQCFTETQLKARRDRDQDFVRRQQSVTLQTNTTSVTRTAISP
jgi:hypothetical protein